MSRPSRTLGEELLFWGGSAAVVGFGLVRWGGPSLIVPVACGGGVALAWTVIRYRMAHRRP